MVESETGRCENVESPLTLQSTAPHAGRQPIGKNAKKRPRTEIIAWNNQQRDMRLSGLLPTIHEYGRTTSPKFLPRPRVVYHWFDVYDLKEQRL